MSTLIQIYNAECAEAAHRFDLTADTTYLLGLWVFLGGWGAARRNLAAGYCDGLHRLTKEGSPTFSAGKVALDGTQKRLVTPFPGTKSFTYAFLGKFVDVATDNCLGGNYSSNGNPDGVFCGQRSNGTRLALRASYLDPVTGDNDDRLMEFTGRSGLTNNRILIYGARHGVDWMIGDMTAASGAGQIHREANTRARNLRGGSFPIITGAYANDYGQTELSIMGLWGSDTSTAAGPSDAQAQLIAADFRAIAAHPDIAAVVGTV